MNPVTIGSTRHQPPAEAQAQGGGEVCIRCGDKPDSADYTDPLTLRGLIEYVRVAADPNQGAMRWHALNLLKQALPHLKRLEEMTAPPSAPVGVEGELMAAIDAGDWEGPKQTVGADLYGARVCISVPPGERPPAAYVYTALAALAAQPGGSDNGR